MLTWNNLVFRRSSQTTQHCGHRPRLQINSQPYFLLTPDSWLLTPAVVSGFIIAALLLLPSAAQAIKAERLIRDGNERYQKEEYDAALKTYQQAAEDKRVSPFAAYNSGNALFRQKKYDEAIDSFKKVYAKEHPQLYRAAQHNIGCAQYRQAEPLIAQQQYEPALEKLKDAMRTYRHALRQAPGSADMKYNYRQALRKFKEIEKLLQQQPKKPTDQQDKKDDENKQDKNKDPQDQKQQDQNQKQDEKDQQQNQQNEPDTQEQKQQKSEQEKMQELSQEMARQLLESLFEDQKPEDMKKLYQLQGRKVQVEKDW